MNRLERWRQEFKEGTPVEVVDSLNSIRNWRGTVHSPPNMWGECDIAMDIGYPNRTPIRVASVGSLRVLTILDLIVEAVE